MLTEKQINNLQPLTNHPKFGPILRDAMKNWQGDADPSTGFFGIISNDDDTFELIPNNKSCCLIGAALLGQKEIESSSITDTTMIKYGISYKDFVSLWRGFDLNTNVYDSDAYIFGEAVRNAIWSNACELTHTGQ